MPRPFHTQFLTIVFLSGFCSLTYQMTWLREFRVLFGCTSGATAAVLAVFLGGLGFGNAFFGNYFGKTKRNILKMAAIAEVLIAILSMMSPLFVDFGRILYYGLGGESGLGYFLTTFLRILLTVFIIGGQCFLMGASFLAISDRVQENDDQGRKGVSILYSANALGGGVGVILTAFFLLEYLGNAKSLLFVGLLNCFLAVWLFWLSGKFSYTDSRKNQIEHQDKQATEKVGWKKFVYLIAFISGLFFFILELLWYRLTIPLTGGSHYSLALILIIVLIGIYLGAWVYPILLNLEKDKNLMLVSTLALQGMFVLLPYLAGETFAWYAAFLTQYFSESSFHWRVFAWTLISLPIVLPPSIVAGIQFPLIVSLLGSGRQKLTNQVGTVYTLNAIGSILGALLGSFVLMPTFGARGLMLSIGISLVVLAGGILVTINQKKMVKISPSQGGLFIGASILVMLCLKTEGPGALWQYSSIGFGRLNETQKTRGEVQELSDLYESEIIGAWEGRECSVAISGGTSPAILTNGKSDSSIHGDIATTIGSGIIPYALVPHACEKVGIIGIGTGMTAASLAGFEDVKQITLFEIEPSVLEAQKYFSEANGDILNNPKIKVVIGDARECLATSNTKFQLISSEPSNLGKAGICQLYTLEHFKKASETMAHNGIYAQWIQAYNLDRNSLHQVVLTMKQVFPRIELWMPASGDLLIIGYKDPGYRHDISLVKKKFETDHGKEMLWKGFLSSSPESIYCRMLARDKTLVAGMPSKIRINTDDLNSLEFRVAKRPTGANDLIYYLKDLFQNFDLSVEVLKQLDSSLLREERLMMLWGGSRNYGQKEPELAAYAFFTQDDYRSFFNIWEQLSPKSLKSKLYGAMAVSSSNRPGGLIIAEISDECPGYALLLRGINLFHRNQFDEGLVNIEKGIIAVKEREWLHPQVAEFVIKKLLGLAAFLTEKQLEELFEIFVEPLPGDVMDSQRVGMLSHISTFLSDEYKVRVIRQYDNKSCLPAKLVPMACDYDPQPKHVKQYNQLKAAGYKFTSRTNYQRKPGQGVLKR